MAEAPKIAFAPFAMPKKGILVVFADGELRLGAATARLLGQTARDLMVRTARSDRFTGKLGAVLDFLAPAGLRAERLIVVGCGSESPDFVRLGGATLAKIPQSAAEATVLLDLPSGSMKPDHAADFALGITLRAYAFDRYKTKRKEGEEKRGKLRIALGVANPPAARKAWPGREAVGAGVMLARDLVNEPPNVLYPEEFARRAAGLKKLGVSVEILDVPAMRKLGMGALLGVGQGSARESRVVVMRWNGGKRGIPPVAFVGKGVCFDTGGNNIKPTQGMDDMRGDMAGAAVVCGLLSTVAKNRLRRNVVGAIGLVENMVDGKSYRPSDILVSMSGQTIEVNNTDAEGRLVLADVIHYVESRFSPAVLIDMATLTGGVIVALGHSYAGLISSSDKLASKIIASGQETGELVWRLPLHQDFSETLKSKFADMRNSGGRYGSASIGASFVQKFVKTSEWAHLDIAGVAFGTKDNEICTSWGTGFGVRLLWRFLLNGRV